MEFFLESGSRGDASPAAAVAKRWPDYFILNFCFANKSHRTGRSAFYAQSKFHVGVNDPTWPTTIIVAGAASFQKSHWKTLFMFLSDENLRLRRTL